ncbi:MAG: hypothetical protein GY820_38805 [Gammaproteobacteria bacterium]|nr:hypothetical protein [Gammaproteobacteria bacterium]
MGCPTEVTIGDNLVFSICCHDPDTGVLTDADSAPTYRVYEDETATAILTGTMTVLDTGNTTGFYTELIACTVANGFENGKTYTIYISATVDSDTGGICFGFKARLVQGTPPAWDFNVGGDEIHIGDTQTFVCTITDGTNAIDISGATTKEMWFEKADGSVVEQTATFTTDGTDGKMQYTCAITDLDIAGTWKMQGYVVLAASTWHSNVQEFEVKANLSS